MPPVAAPLAPERFESGEQPTRALVETAGEQHDGGARLLGHSGRRRAGPAESGVAISPIVGRRPACPGEDGGAVAGMWASCG